MLEEKNYIIVTNAQALGRWKSGITPKISYEGLFYYNSY
jgi:hypothetical protein